MDILSEAPTSPERRPFCSPIKRRTDSKEACFKDVEIIELPPLINANTFNTNSDVSMSTFNLDTEDINRNDSEVSQINGNPDDNSLKLENTRVRTLNMNTGFNIITYQNATPSDEMNFFDGEGNLKRQKTAPAECIGKLLREFNNYNSDTCSTAEDSDDKENNHHSSGNKHGNILYNKIKSSPSNYRLFRTSSMFNRSILSTRVNKPNAINISAINNPNTKKSMGKSRKQYFAPPQTTANVMLKNRKMKTITNF